MDVQDFYKDNNHYTNIHFIYINKLNEIEKMREETIILFNQNILTKEEIIELVKKNRIMDNKTYKLKSILKYHITLDADDIRPFLIENIEPNFLTSFPFIDNIIFEKSISMFQDLNDLFFIFYLKHVE